MNELGEQEGLPNINVLYDPARWTDVSAAFLREYLSITTGKSQEHTLV